MSTTNKPAKISLPSLVSDLGLAAKFDNFNAVLNSTPPASWLKVNNGVQYQPVERVKKQHHYLISRLRLGYKRC